MKRDFAAAAVVPLAGLALALSGAVAGQELATGLAPSERVVHGRPAPPSARDGVGPTDHRGGPDGYGYVFRDSLAPDGPVFDWVELEGDPAAEVHSLPRLASTQRLSLGFPFEHYGIVNDVVVFATNGLVALDGHAIGSQGGECRPWPGPYPDDLAAVFWDRLRPCSTDWPFHTEIFTRAFAAGECPYAGYAGACFVGELPDLCRDLGTGPPYIALGRWEAILFDDDSLVFQYLDLGEDPGDGYSVGVQGHSSSDPDEVAHGLLYGCHEPDVIVPPLAIRFWAPEVVAGADDATLQGCPGSSVRYRMRMKNTTGASDEFLAHVIDSDAPVDVPPALGIVADGEWAELEAIVHVPPTASQGTVLSTTIEVVSATDPGRLWAAELTTTVSSPAISRGALSASEHMDNSAVYFDGGIYVYGGVWSEGAMERFDVAAGTWRTLASDPSPIRYPGDAAVGRDAGGEAVIVFVPDLQGAEGFHAYRIAEDRWEVWPAPAGFPSEGIWAPDIACDESANTCYITGGATAPGVGDLATVYAYDVGSHAVEQLPEMTTPRDFHASFLWDGMLCVAGGLMVDADLQSTQCMDLASQEWRPENTDLPPLPTPSWGAADGVLWLGDRWAPVIGSGSGRDGPEPVILFDGTGWIELGYPEEDTYRLEGVAVGNVFYLMHGAWQEFLTTPFAQTVEVCGSETADLWVTKKLGTQGSVALGELVEFVIRAGNEGPQRAVGVSVTDPLDPAMEYVGDSCGGSWDAGTRVWTWTPGSLPAGARVECRLTASVATDAGPVIRNAVTIGGEGIDPQPGDETSEVFIALNRQGIPGLTPVGTVVLAIALAVAAGVLLRRR